MKAEPYLSFNGRCEEALNFYVDAVGAKIEALMRFSEAPPDGAPGCGPGTVPPDNIMHACLRIGDTLLMASDGMSQGEPRFDGIALALSADDEAAARRQFEALAAGGTVTMPLAPTFFAHLFGMLNDRFGLAWMVLVPR